MHKTEKVIVYHSKAEEAMDEWLWDHNGVLVIAIVSVVIFAAAGIYSVFDKMRRRR